MIVNILNAFTYTLFGKIRGKAAFCSSYSAMYGLRRSFIFNVEICNYLWSSLVLEPFTVLKSLFFELYLIVCDSIFQKSNK